MLYLPLTVIMMSAGFGLYFFSKLFPPVPEAMMYITTFEMLGLIVLIIPAFMLLYIIIKNKLLWNIEELPKDKLLIWFLRRDGSIIPVLGTRSYPGESFIEVPRLGLIHDLGKGSVYRIGKNPVRFALENVNHTPNPTFANFTNWLYKLGYNNLEEVKKTINAESNYKDKQIEIVEKIDKYKPIVEQLEKEIIEEKQQKQFHKEEHEQITSIIDRLKPKAFKK